MPGRKGPQGIEGQPPVNTTALLVEMALARLTESQKHLPAEKRRYPTSAILAEVAILRPDGPPLHRSTLRRNPEVQRLIAAARGQGEPSPPDFRKYGGWTSPQGRSPRHHTRRRAALSRWSVRALAEHVAGLEELARHCLERRQQIEAVGWTSGPWPENRPYPLTPFWPFPGVLERYKRYQRWTRRELVTKALRLEQDVAEHQAHLLALDEEHGRQLPAGPGR